MARCGRDRVYLCLGHGARDFVYFRRWGGNYLRAVAWNSSVRDVSRHDTRSAAGELALDPVAASRPRADRTGRIAARPRVFLEFPTLLAAAFCGNRDDPRLARRVLFPFCAGLTGVQHRGLAGRGFTFPLRTVAIPAKVMGLRWKRLS